MRPPLRVTYTGNRNHVLVRGHGSWEILHELRGRKPYWSRRERAWTTTERTAADILAVAQKRGWSVIVEGPVVAEAGASGADAPSAAEGQEALW